MLCSIVVLHYFMLYIGSIWMISQQCALTLTLGCLKAVVCGFLLACRDVGYLANMQQSAAITRFKRLANIILHPGINAVPFCISCWWALLGTSAFCPSLNELCVCVCVKLVINRIVLLSSLPLSKQLSGGISPCLLVNFQTRLESA